MPRLNERRYQFRMIFAASLYLAALLFLLPLARAASSVPLKGFLAVVPTLPMLYVIWLMAQRVRASDELEQRTHLVALGITVAVVAACSLIGGFLATAQVWSIDGSILIWVFPLMLLCYEGAYQWIARRYGSDMVCDAGIPLGWRLAIVAAMMLVAGLFAYLRRDIFSADLATGVVVGMATALVGWGLFKFVVYLRRRHVSAQGIGNDA